MRKNFFLIRFLLSLTLCLGGGWLTGLITRHGVKEWYPHLIKAPGTPADLVFPIVWTALYFLMGVSLTLFWISRSADKMRAFLFFIIQLFLNFIWSWLFFYFQSPGWALIDVVVLWIFILLTIGTFKRHTLYGSYLLVPYFAWVTYAAYLNLFIWLNN